MNNPNLVKNFIENPNWHQQETINRFFTQATSLPVEKTGEARYQLGHYDGVNNENPASANSDYVRGYLAGCQELLNSIKSRM